MKPKWIKLAVLVIVVALLSPHAVRGDEDCDVDASVRLDDSVEGYKYTAYTFEVLLKISEQCADISYTLVITYRNKDDEEKRKLMPRTIQLRSRSVSEYHTYKTLNENAIESYEVEQIHCTVCL